MNLSLYLIIADGLSLVSPQRVGDAMQVSEQNQMDGLEGRSELLQKLVGSLRKSPVFFGQDARPGNIIGA